MQQRGPDLDSGDKAVQDVDPSGKIRRGVNTMPSPARLRQTPQRPLPLLSGGGLARVQRGGATPASARRTDRDGEHAESRIVAGLRSGGH